MVRDLDLIRKVEEITKEKYMQYQVYNNDEVVLIPEEEEESMLENVVYQYSKLEEEFEDYKQYVNDNFRRITPVEMFGDCEDNFHRRGEV